VKSIPESVDILKIYPLSGLISCPFTCRSVKYKEKSNTTVYLQFSLSVMLFKSLEL